MRVQPFARRMQERAENRPDKPMTEREFVIAYVLARATCIEDFTPYGAARKARDVWKQEIAPIPN